MARHIHSLRECRLIAFEVDGVFQPRPLPADDLDVADSTRFLAFDPNPALFGPSVPITSLLMILPL
jgi:hypothetical protein